jgi:hypothetical protein
MSLFKPLRGSRTTLDAQPLHDGYAYFCTDDGSFHIDYTDADGNLQRKQINAKDCETIMGVSLDELKAHIANQDAVVLAESQAYTEQAIEAVKADFTTQDAAILYEAQTYTDNALAEAKESGDLKGEKGDDGISATHIWNGTTLTVTSASGTSSANLKGDKGDQGIQGEKGADGAKGEDGYTPVRGTDYWTDADKAEIKSYIDDAILNGEW